VGASLAVFPGSKKEAPSSTREGWVIVEVIKREWLLYVIVWQILNKEFASCTTFSQSQQSISDGFLAHMHILKEKMEIINSICYASFSDQFKIRNLLHIWLFHTTTLQQSHSAGCLTQEHTCSAMPVVMWLLKFSFPWLPLYAHLGLEYPCFLPASTMIWWACLSFLSYRLHAWTTKYGDFCCPVYELKQES